MTPFISNIRSAFEADGATEKRDSGEIVSQIVWIAGMVIAGLLVVNWIGAAAMNKAADIATCIEGSNTMANTGNATATCNNSHSTGAKSFKKDTGYTSRYTGK